MSEYSKDEMILSMDLYSKVILSGNCFLAHQSDIELNEFRNLLDRYKRNVPKGVQMNFRGNIEMLEETISLTEKAINLREQLKNKFRGRKR